jgi:amidase
MMWRDGYGVSRQDLYVTSLMDYHRSWHSRADELSETTKLFTLLGTYIKKQHGGRYYGKAMNVCRRLTAAYDAVLAEHDLLMMPTTPIKASRLPGPNASREEVVEKALNMIGNTFDIAHHPAMAVPWAMSEGLPVSLMLVGSTSTSQRSIGQLLPSSGPATGNRCRTLGCNHSPMGAIACT